MTGTRCEEERDAAIREVDRLNNELDEIKKAVRVLVEAAYDSDLDGNLKAW